MTSSGETDPTPPTITTATPPLASSGLSSNPPNPQPQPVLQATPARATQTNIEAAPNPRLQFLATKKASLESTLQTLHTQRSALIASTTLPSGLPMPAQWSESERTKAALDSANATIKSHIALLQAYNEIKDIGQGLMGLIAEARGVRVKGVMEEMGLEEKD